MKQRVAIPLLLLLCSTLSMAQESKQPQISFEARADYQRTDLAGEHLKEQSGFEGYILNFILNGNISPEFSYKYRQRLNGINRTTNFFDATDWIYLTYKPSERFSISGGKQVVYVGGWELDKAPIDCYFLSEYCYHFNCYQWGVSLGYQLASGHDSFLLQMCQSPFRSTYKAMTNTSPEMYAYNLAWYGHHGFYQPIWTVNFMEYAPGKFVNYLSFGNRFRITERLTFDLDFMNRASAGQKIVGEDFTVVGEVSYRPLDQLCLFARASHDSNSTDSPADLCVLPGTHITRVGGGVEYFPLRDKRVRLHAFYSYAMGENTHPAAVVKDRLSLFNIGLTWRIKVL